MRNREGEDLPVDFIFAFNSTKEFDDIPHNKDHIISILPVCDIECERVVRSLFKYVVLEISIV